MSINFVYGMCQWVNIAQTEAGLWACLAELEFLLTGTNTVGHSRPPWINILWTRIATPADSLITQFVFTGLLLVIISAAELTLLSF